MPPITAVTRPVGGGVTAADSKRVLGKIEQFMLDYVQALSEDRLPEYVTKRPAAADDDSDPEQQAQTRPKKPPVSKFKPILDSMAPATAQRCVQDNRRHAG